MFHVFLLIDCTSLSVKASIDTMRLLQFLNSFDSSASATHWYPRGASSKRVADEVLPTFPSARCQHFAFQNVVDHIFLLLQFTFKWLVTFSSPDSWIKFVLGDKR